MLVSPPHASRRIDSFDSTPACVAARWLSPSSPQRFDVGPRGGARGAPSGTPKDCTLLHRVKTPSGVTIGIKSDSSRLVRLGRAQFPRANTTGVRVRVQAWSLRVARCARRSSPRAARPAAWLRDRWRRERPPLLDGNAATTSCVGSPELRRASRGQGRQDGRRHAIRRREEMVHVIPSTISARSRVRASAQSGRWSEIWRANFCFDITRPGRSPRWSPQ